MPIFDTSTLEPDQQRSERATSNIYNGLDCCVTFEIYEELAEQLSDEPQNVKDTYQFSLAKIAPVMNMELTGTLIDQKERAEVLAKLQTVHRRIEANLQRITDELFGYKINYNSPVQVKNLFYGTLQIKPVKARNSKGVWAPSSNREALEKISFHLNARPFTSHILKLRDLGKMIGSLKTEIDKDSRVRSSFNIAGTNTGRLSSSFSDFGTGTNLQNQDTRIRPVFIADPGMYLLNIDLEQADARNVGAIIWNLFHHSHGPELAGAYLDACESGDLHTKVTQMVWPDLEWTGEQKLDKGVASQLFYREDSYRDMSKKLGHGTNYFGVPKTMAMHTKTSAPLIQSFQKNYFKAFPLIGNYEHDLSKDDWHGSVYRQLKEDGHLTTPFGRRRFFFDRYKNPSTLREAIAYSPQSMTAWEIDQGFLQVWRAMPDVKLLIQVHDSILLQFPFEKRDEYVPRILELLKVVLRLTADRDFFVPLEAAGGWNWGYPTYNKAGNITANHHGLIKWNGMEKRQPPVRTAYKRPSKLRELIGSPDLWMPQKT